MNKLKLNSGLLEVIPPLLENISHLYTKQHKSENFDDIMIGYAKSFVEQSSICVAILDLNFNIVTFSPVWEKWFKHNLSPCNLADGRELHGENFVKLATPCPKVIERALLSSAKGKTIRFEILEYKVKKRNRYIKWESLALNNKNHSPSHIMIFSDDITNNQKLVAKHKKLRETNVMLQNFAFIFSHDLIQPMKQISNFTTLLKEHITELNLNDSLIQYSFDSIAKSISQMKNLAEGIIFYCKQGQYTARAQATSVKEAIDEVIHSCLQMNNIQIKNFIDEDIYLFINKACLLQLFQNLLTNAVKHSSAADPLITIKGHTDYKDSYYQIDIHNHGVCPAHLRSEVFKPFVSSFADGAGLGLMICKKIVNAYDGSIEIKSSSKNGTTVSVKLPIADTALNKITPHIKLHNQLL